MELEEQLCKGAQCWMLSETFPMHLGNQCPHATHYSILSPTTFH